jgi:uncharacterized protein YaiL (DUF2058 family)
MLDLKAKLLAAGVVTAEQVKKVEDDEAARRDRDAQRREAERRRREEGPPPRRDDRGPPRDDRGPRRDDGARGPRRDGPPGADRGPRPERTDRPRGPRRDGGAAPAPVDGQQQSQQQPTSPRPPRARDTRSFKERRVEENLEKRARREHEWTEAAKWRTRLEELKAAGKTDQYEVTRGWVMKERLDNKAISEAAEKFHFVSYAGTLSHLTVEPEIKARLSDGTAAIVGFVGYNGLEHAVVPADVAVDMKIIRAEWMRHLIGVTDIEPPLVRPPQEPAAEGEAEAPAEGEVPVEVAADDVVDADAPAAAEVPADGTAEA